jgi:hypothetical protein
VQRIYFDGGEISWNASKDYWLVGRYSLCSLPYLGPDYDRDYRYGRYDRYDRSERDRWERERDRDRDWRRDRFGRYPDMMIDMMTAGMAGATIATTGVTGTAVPTVVITNKS